MKITKKLLKKIILEQYLSNSYHGNDSSWYFKIDSTPSIPIQKVKKGKYYSLRSFYKMINNEIGGLDKEWTKLYKDFIKNYKSGKISKRDLELFNSNNEEG